VPELPEVETTRRGIAPLLVGQTVQKVIVRDRRLRWPVPRQLSSHLCGGTFTDVDRRAKYLLVYIESGCLIMHLGMSGSLRVIPADTPPERHDHLDIVLSNGQCLRFRDPRRFGSVHWTKQPPALHPLLASLGPEPWDDAFTANYLHQRSRGRTLATKAYIMDAKTVVGVGNIYASEALFAAGIHPARQAGQISLHRYERLREAIMTVLDAAIAAGGTTLRDFVSSDGSPGYFFNQLQVYDRAGAPCVSCETPIKRRVLGQRASYFCPFCQR
jgi:formamidopyrimidine-DNA glycosylase